jgi:hypothetical protein
VTFYAGKSAWFVVLAFIVVAAVIVHEIVTRRSVGRRGIAGNEDSRTDGQ